MRSETKEEYIPTKKNKFIKKYISIITLDAISIFLLSRFVGDYGVINYTSIRIVCIAISLFIESIKKCFKLYKRLDLCLETSEDII